MSLYQSVGNLSALTVNFEGKKSTYTAIYIRNVLVGFIIYQTYGLDKVFKRPFTTIYKLYSHVYRAAASCKGCIYSYGDQFPVLHQFIASGLLNISYVIKFKKMICFGSLVLSRAEQFNIPKHIIFII